MMIERLKGLVREAAIERRETAIDISHRLHHFPELAFQEHRAATWLSDLLEGNAFEVSRGVAGLDTAFTASTGSGELVVGLCAEYDALPEIGHACGHNVISGASVLTALSLQPIVEELGITLRVFGTPAEELGGGKIIMLENGVFNGVHAIMMVHPAPHDLIEPSVLAMTMLDVEFRGTVPPSMHPERGRSAGDAVTIAQAGIGLLRQHITASDRISGHIRSEGHSANVLPAHAALRYCIRAGSDIELDSLVARVIACFTGAAFCTGTEVTVSEPSPRFKAMRHDETLGRLYRANAERLGREFGTHEAENRARSASTDFGNISSIVHAIHPLIGIESNSFSNHQREFATYCGGESGDLAVFDAGLAMGWTIVDLATDTETRNMLLNTQ